MHQRGRSALTEMHDSILSSALTDAKGVRFRNCTARKHLTVIEFQIGHVRTWKDM